MTSSSTNQENGYEYVVVPGPYNTKKTSSDTQLNTDNGYEYLDAPKSVAKDSEKSASSEIGIDNPYSEVDTRSKNDIPGGNESIHSSLQSLQRFNAYEVVDAASSL